MKTLTLYRMRPTPTATFGRIEAEDSAQLCVTLEPAWVDANADGIGDRGVSRIPAGTYTCRRDIHGKTKPNPYEVWEVLGVPGRSEIHIHRGTKRSHTQGCILVGSAFHGPDEISGSAHAFDKLMKETARDSELTLVVIDP